MSAKTAESRVRAKRETKPKADVAHAPHHPAAHTSHALKIKIDDLGVFDPLTDNQKLFYDAYKAQDYFITLHGVAGTGKTFCAVYKALEEVLDKSNPFKRVIIIRSAVQGREMGHLPGDVGEKMDVYTQPYRQICETLFNKKDAWDRLEEQGYIQFVSSSFVRGMTFDNAIVILDEGQNCTWEELSTVITRVGHMSKFILCGDYRQNDLYKKSSDKSGLVKFLEIAKNMNSNTRIEMTVDDIVRSSLVKDFIIATLAYEDKTDH